MIKEDVKPNNIFVNVRNMGNKIPRLITRSVSNKTTTVYVVLVFYLARVRLH